MVAGMFGCRDVTVGRRIATVVDTNRSSCYSNLTTYNIVDSQKTVAPFLVELVVDTLLSCGEINGAF